MLNGDIFETSTVIFTSLDRIGNGASSVVFQAIHKLSGETVAAKVLKDHSRYNLKYLNREVTALKQLNHPNIIRFYGVERELHSGSKVVILQYCQHSLHSFLQEPDNRRGLPDEELLILFDNICAALSYLRRKEFIHRDVKPGNILRYITHDLRPVYVLSDFGTSRNLEGDGEYFSLVGTEEYLHPAVYEKAFVDRNVATAFYSGTDLWSVGCTLYQAVTSQMPFQPYEGARNNRKVMYEMLSCKPRRTISGYQEDASGEVKWMASFPKGCKASLHLQEIFMNIIADLLEADSKIQISYEELFKQQRELHSRFRLKIIQSSNGTDFNLYMTPNTSLPELKEEIARFTDIQSGEQTLYYEDVVLEKVVLKGAHLKKKFVPEKTNYIVIDTSNSLFEKLEPYKLDPFPLFSSSCTISDDYPSANTRHRIVHDIVYLVNQSYHFQQKTDRTLVTMWSMQKTFMLKQEKSFECLRLTFEECKHNVNPDILFAITKTSNETENETKASAWSEVLLDEIDRKLGIVAEKMKIIQAKSIVIFQDLEEPKDLCDCLCLQTAETYRDKMKDITHRMKLRKKEQKNTTEFQKYQHLRDRHEAEEVSASCLSLWQDHCWKRKQKQYNRFIISKSVFHECHEMLVSARKLLMEIRNGCDKLKRRNSKSKDIYKGVYQKMDFRLSESKGRGSSELVVNVKSATSHITSK